MTFPDGFTTITVTGQHLLGFGGEPLSGAVVFTASGAVADPVADALLTGSAFGQVVSGVMTPLTIPATDAVDPGFTYTITFRLQTADGSPSHLPAVQNVSIPSALGATVDLSALVPGSPPPSPTAFNSDNTWTGVQTFGGAPPLIIPAGAAAGDVLTSDAAGHASWQLPAGGGGGGITPPAGDLGGTAGVPTVTGTHLASPLPLAQGGTGQGTQQAALDALAGAHTSGQVLRGNGTHVALSALQAGDIPALAYDASGAAATAQSAAQGYADGKVATETSRAQAAEGLAAQKSANLSDLANAGMARTNLGLGSAATQASTAFDSAGTAATAQAAAEAYTDTETSRAEAAEALLAPKASPALTGTPTAPTAAALTASTQVATTAYADAATAAETARAGAAEALAAQKAANLSDLASAGTARTNLGLGTAATQASTAFDAAGAAAAAQAASLPVAGGALTGHLAPAVASLTFGTTISVNAALGNDFRLTLTASTGTIANPSNPADGQDITFAVAQDGTGGRTVAWGTAYDFGTTGAPVLSPGASKVDLIGFKYHAGLAKWLCMGSALGF